MKRKELISGLSFILPLLLSISSFAQDIVCIDPGHGGPGASKYWNNGGGGNEGRGAVGPNGLTEQWINLEVAKELRWQIYFYPSFPVVMTRETDTTNLTLVQRARIANDSLADWFISIHHQGLEPGDFQRTMAFYCDSPKTPVYPKENRITDSLLAKKILFMVQNYFHYPDGCSSRCGPGPNCKDNGILQCEQNYTVLEYSTMVSALSEASNISYDEYEEWLFDGNYVHINDEAYGLYYGWKSYMQGAGIAKVMTRWIGGDGGQLWVDAELRSSPFFSCWEQYEQHILQADNQELGGYYCEFHHWLEVETGYTMPYPVWIISVPFMESTHTYIAYYQGGPYYAELYMPDGGEEWLIGDEAIIIWGLGYPNTSLGVDSSTLIDVYLDRNSGQNGFRETLFTDIPRLGNIGISWAVTGPASNKCRVKIVARDCVENTATDVSSYDFTIRIPHIVGDANSDGKISNSDVVYLINFLFKGGPPPEPLWKGDANGDCRVSLSDIVYLISYLNKGGSPPVECQTSCGWDCQR